MLRKPPDIEKLKAAKNGGKLAEALKYTKDWSVRRDAAIALGIVGGVSALTPLVSLAVQESERAEVRAAAIEAVGKVCAFVMKSHHQTDLESVFGSELRRREKQENKVKSARRKLRLIIEKGSAELSSVAVRACMSLPLEKNSAMIEAFNSKNESGSESVFGGGAKERVPVQKSSDKNTQNNFEAVTEAALEKGRKEEIVIHETDLDKPVKIAPNTYWVGRREDTLLERNIYLRVFKNGEKTVNLLIDPGPPEDLTPLVKKLSSLIGGIRNLHVMFLNHQDPDVSYNSGHLQKLNPNCVVLCSEDSWRLVKFYGLDPKRYKSVESFKNMKTVLSTGHSLSFIPTPYCHFRGAVMLFDHETGVLFSGDFLGGLSFKQDLYASGDSWEGIATFHQIYMPSQAALRHAVSNVRQMEKAPGIIAPQHGSIIEGELVTDFLERVENLEVGLDLFLKEHTKKNYVSALNELLAEFSQIVDSNIIPQALSVFRSDGSFPNAITVGDNGVTDIKVDAQYAVELFLRELRQRTPADALDLVDISIVRVLTMWKIPLPEFMLGGSTESESVFGTL